MKVQGRHLILGMAAACLLIGAIVSMIPRGSEPATSSIGPAPSGVSNLERPADGGPERRSSRPASVMSDVVRERTALSTRPLPRLDRETREILGTQGVGAAFAFLKQIIEQGPSEDPGERIRRSGALKYLAYLCSLDGRFRPEIEALLQKQARDPDRLVRRVSLACLLDCPTILQDADGRNPSWALLPERRLTDGPALSAYALKVSAETRRQALDLLGERCLNEPDLGSRYGFMHLLAANPDPRNISVLARAALEERHEDTRYWALVGFGRLPPGEDARLALK